MKPGMPQPVRTAPGRDRAPRRRAGSSGALNLIRGAGGAERAIALANWTPYIVDQPAEDEDRERYR
jgi:hypothetical protein